MKIKVKKFLFVEPKDIQISNLELSIRAKSALENAGITDVEKIMNRTIKELLSIKGLGLRDLQELLTVTLDRTKRNG